MKSGAILPAWDRYLSAPVTDLNERGIDQELAVVAWGEFGRQPRIDPKPVRRDHWASANVALFTGGGLHMGQVIGETDHRAVTIKATSLHAARRPGHGDGVLGIDPA